MNKRLFEIRHMNGTILSTLSAYYPNGLSGGNIFAHAVKPLSPGMEWERVFIQLTFLKERGYLEYVKDRGPRGVDGPKDLIYRLTPAGVEVASGLKEDSAV